MKRNMKITIAAMAAIVTLGSNAAVHAAQQVTVGTWLPPGHVMNRTFFPEWEKQVKEATNGELFFKLEYHKGHPKAIFQLVEDGVYDAGWSFHGYIPGRFKLTVLPELPLLGAGAKAASVAYWGVHKKYLAKANEHDGLVLAALYMHGPGQIQMRSSINSLADMKGKKIRLGGGVQGLIGQKLGVAPIAAPGSKVYEILSQGVADGVFMPVGEQAAIRLSEVTKFVYEIPGGMYLGSFSIFMNPDFVESLDKKTRKGLLSTTGKDLSAFVGGLWEKNDELGYKAAKKSGVKIVQLPASDVDKFKKYSVEIEKNWLVDVADRNVKVEKALAEFRKNARALEKKMAK